MSTVSAKVVANPRKDRSCDQCGRAMKAHVRLYGNADDPDPKYVLRICPPCAQDSGDPKVILACGDLPYPESEARLPEHERRSTPVPPLGEGK